PREEQLRALRRQLLFSENPDEMLTLGGVANLDPLSLDLNPREYTYGTSYFYLTAGAIGTWSLPGAVELRRNPIFYLARPSEMGRLYLAGRSLNVLFLLVLMLGVYLSAVEMGVTGRDAVLCAAAIGSLPGIITWGAVMKPHLPATALGMLGFAMSLRLLNGVRKGRNYCFSVFLITCAAALQYTCVLLILFPVVALLRQVRKNELGRRTALLWLAAGGIGSGIVFLLLNPFHLLNLETVRQDIAHTASMHSFQLMDAHLPLVVGFLLFCLCGPALLLLVGGLIRFVTTFSCRRILQHRLFPTAVVIFCISIFATGHVVAGRYYANNARFLLLVLPQTIFLLHLINWQVNRKYFRLTCVVIILTGIYVAGGHLMASTHYRPQYRAAEWIKANVNQTATIGVSDEIAPFRYPPFPVLQNRVTKGPKEVLTKADVVLASKPMPELGQPEKVWRSSLPYFQLSFADQRRSIYRP
ncbi:MAG: hypothetical protein ACOCTQ_01720, partial [Planctomycetota bacterium]